MTKLRLHNLETLLFELRQIVIDSESTKTEKVFALALAYLLRDMCPEDRTSKHVFRKFVEKMEGKTNIVHKVG
jgi:hypothetical protein